MMSMSGSCLCGKVSFQCEGEPQFVGKCYCVDCRKASGTGHGTHVAMAADQVSMSGVVKGYGRPADSGNIVTRFFCPDCGSAIFSTNDAMEGLQFIRASALDDPDQITPMLSVYTSRAPSWDKVDDSIPSFAEMPTEMPA